MPIPPASANAIAILDSVTVSIAADTNGTLIDMLFVNWVLVDASLGIKSLYRGKRSTSSNVNAFDFTLSMSDYNQDLREKKVSSRFRVIYVVEYLISKQDLLSNNL